MGHNSNFITKRITKAKTLFELKIPVYVKLVKLIFPLYFSKHIFTNLQ